MNPMRTSAHLHGHLELLAVHLSHALNLRDAHNIAVLKLMARRLNNRHKALLVLFRVNG